jgi:hypothetical protein
LFQAVKRSMQQRYAALENLDVIGSIAHNFRTIEIDDNPALSRMDGNERPVKFSGNLIITNNQSLHSISWMQEIDHIWGGLDIRKSAIENLDDLQNLKFIGGNLTILNNTNLTNAEGLRNLRQIGGKVLFRNNRNLDFETVGPYTGEAIDFSEFPITVNGSLIEREYSWGGHTEAEYHECIIRLCSDWEVINFQSGGAYFHLDGFLSQGDPYGSITSEKVLSAKGLKINGLLNVPNLRRVEGDAIVWEKASGDLSSLSTVMGDLKIRQSELTNLSLFDALQTLGGNLEIADNENLPLNKIRAFVDRLRANGFEGTVNRVVAR